VRLVAFCLVLGVAHAAPQPDDTRKKLEALADDLQKVRSQLPSAIEAVHALENRVESLSRELQRLGSGRDAEPFVQRAIDELRVEVSALERRLAATQQRLAELPAPTVSFGYDDGLYLKTEPVRVQLNLFAMPRYIATLRRDAPNSSEFELHRAQLAIKAELLGWIELQLMLDFGSEFLGADRANLLRDAFIDVKPLAWLALRAGQFKVPFSRQRLVYSGRQAFTDRSVATRAFSFDRDLGGMIEFSPFGQKLLIQIAMTDGIMAGPATHNDNLDFAYTLRIVGQPLGPVPLSDGDVARTRKPRFSIGAAFQYDLSPNEQRADLDRNGVVDNVGVYNVGAEAAFRWRGLAAEAEYFLRVEQRGVGLPLRILQGGYAQLTGMVWRGLMLGARGAFAQPHTLGGAERLGLVGDQPRSVMQVGALVTYWIWREMVRAQVAYDFQRDVISNNTTRLGHILQIQLQAGF
jgi:hypothetical protein